MSKTLCFSRSSEMKDTIKWNRQECNRKYKAGSGRVKVCLQKECEPNGKLRNFGGAIAPELLEDGGLDKHMLSTQVRDRTSPLSCRHFH